MLESYTNLGPIVDMCVVDLERQSRQVRTKQFCSDKNFARSWSPVLEMEKILHYVLFEPVLVFMNMHRLIYEISKV